MRAIAKSLIKHNGNYYQAGEQLPAMSESNLAKLVAANVVLIKDGTVAPEKPEDATLTPADKVLETKHTAEVANMPISMKLKKTALIGIARANGITVDQTETPAEVYKKIKAFREKEGIVIADVEPVVKPKAVNPEAPKKEEVEAAEKAAKEVKDEPAPGGEDSDEGKDKPTK